MHEQDSSSTIDMVKTYYGKVLSTKADLQTSACCVPDSLPEPHRAIVEQIHPEVLEKFYGCGSPIPAGIDGCTVLDLGCGSGRDVYLLSKLVGPHGRVIGVDMTPEQIAVARKYQNFHADAFGHKASNVTLLQGYIEDLKAAGVADHSVDLVVSNCVINLSPDKGRVFREIFRVLKPGGELLFADIFAGRRIPPPLAKDPFLLGECLGGALYIEDFRRLLRSVGCLDYRVLSKVPVVIKQPELEQRAGMIDFFSVTVRAFKLTLEDLCEDYGQVAYYLGTVPGAPHAFVLDDHHIFRTGMPMLVCSNTAAMVSQTRLAEHFKVVGDLSTHYGPFDCKPVAAGVPSTTPFGACC